VADRFSGALATAPYFRNYERLLQPWRLIPAEMDDELVIIGMREQAGEWVRHSVARLSISDHLITDITDYLHCPWVLPFAASIRPFEPVIIPKHDVSRRTSQP
jgi:hypothetical protein